MSLESRVLGFRGLGFRVYKFFFFSPRIGSRFRV